MGTIYAIKEALESSSTIATVIHAILRDKYDEQIYGWDPATVYLEVKDDFGADMCSDATDKWSAMQTIMTTDAFFRRLDAFFAICNTLADGSPFFTSFNPPSVEEIAWAITEVALNREFLNFSYPIKIYMKTILKSEGFDEDYYPEIFNVVFSKNPSSKKIRTGLAQLSNETNLNRFLISQLKTMEEQFDRLPELKHVDDFIIDVGFQESFSKATAQ